MKNNLETGVKKVFVCPICGKSKSVVIGNPVGGMMSIQCSNCKDFYVVNFSTWETEKGKAIRNDSLRDF